MKWRISAVVGFTIVCFQAMCNPAGAIQGGEMTREMASKVTPFPPTKVTANRNSSVVTVNWEPVPLESIVSYVVYRQSGLDGPYVKLGSVTKPPFVDKTPPPGELIYAVSAINSLKRSSPMAKTAPIR
jgi:fibronectin type 3 domain-containing protein